MRILLTELFTLPEDVKDRFANMGLEVDSLDADAPINPADYDVVFGQTPFKTFPYEAFTNVKFVQLSSAGTDHLPVERWLAEGVHVSNARGVYSAPMAEHIILAILAANRKALTFVAQQKQAVWKKHKLIELGYRKIVFLGTGSIAVETAKRLIPFGAYLVGLNTDGRRIEPFMITAKLNAWRGIVGACDVVVNTLPYTAATHHFLNREFFAAMKEGAMVINVGRGKSLDEEALLEALDSGHLSHAALDVFEEEPLPQNSPLWAHERVSITPHNSNSGQLLGERMYDLFLTNLGHYARGEVVENAL
jgi:phosphoglycerate dehydrogenase-like enzyme